MFHERGDGLGTRALLRTQLAATAAPADPTDPTECPIGPIHPIRTLEALLGPVTYYRLFRLPVGK